MHQFYLKLSKYRVPIIISIIIITIFFLFCIIGMPGLKINTDLRSLIPASSKEAKINKERNNVDYLVVAIEEKEGSPPLFSKKILNNIQRAIFEIDQIENLKIAISPFAQIQITPLVKNGKILSYSTAPILKQNIDDEEIYYYIESDEEALAFKENLQSSFITQKLVINEEGTMLAIMLDYSKFKTIKQNLPDQLSTILDNYADSFSYSMAGTALFEKYVGKFLISDLALLLGLGILFSLFLFYISFRSLKTIFLPAIILLLSTIWMLGTMALLEIEISVVSVIAPPLILALTSSYCVHILDQYYQQATLKSRGTLTKSQFVFSILSRIAPTILMASATTIVALLGLLVTKIPQTRLFAISTSLGIFYGAVLALTFLPSILSYLNLPTIKNGKRIKNSLLSGLLKKMVPRIIRFRYLLFVFLILIFLSPLISMRFMSYESDYINYFPADNPAVLQASKVSRNFTGVTQLYIDYEINDEKLKRWARENNQPTQEIDTFFYNYDLLMLISNFEQELEKNQLVRYLISFPKMLCEVNNITENSYSIPTNLMQRLRLDSIFKFLRSQKSMQFEFINPRADRITTTIRLTDLENEHGGLKEEDLNHLLKKIERELTSFMPPYVDYIVDGYRVDFIDLRVQMNEDLSNSTLLSTILIFFTIALTFKSGFCGLYALIPMFCGICLNFLLMAIAKIPLDMTTIMVSSVAIGIGVDDAIHFLLTFRKNYAETSEEDRLKESLIKTMEEAGRPIVITSMAVILGMGMMIFAQFTPIAYFGCLVSASLFFATIACLIFLPAVIAIRYSFKEKTPNKNFPEKKEQKD